MSLASWKLRGRTKGWTRFEQDPLSIQEPLVPIRDVFTKAYPVLGSRGMLFQGGTMVKIRRLNFWFLLLLCRVLGRSGMGFAEKWQDDCCRDPNPKRLREYGKDHDHVQRDFG